MPICYQLINKDTGQVDKLVDIDNAMCADMGHVPDDVDWLGNWENLFGLPMATGATFNELRDRCQPDDDLQLDILDYLEQHYTVENWRER